MNMIAEMRMILFDWRVNMLAIRETTAQNMKEIRPDKDTHPLIPSRGEN